MTYTEDSYGTAGKVNLSGLTTDTNWQGLAGLDSVTGSGSKYRSDHRLSLFGWTNYLKDVDRVFALLNSHSEQKQASQTEIAQSDGLPVISTEHPVPARSPLQGQTKPQGTRLGSASFDLAS